MIRTTVEALGGAQAVPSELIPVRELHQRLLNELNTLRRITADNA